MSSMFSFLPHNLFTNHIGQNSTGLSPRLWSRVTGTIMDGDGAARLVLAGDDFMSFHGLLTSTAGDYEGGYKSYEDANNTISQVADKKGGVIKLAGHATDNNESWLQSGGSSGVLGAISDTAADSHLTACECRFQVSSVADDVAALFLGLAEEGLAAANTKADNTGVMADKDYIGFDTVHTNSGTAGTNAVMNFVYRKSGQTAQTPIAGLQTLEANTWYKMGFLFDPRAQASKRISVYLDNVEQPTYVTAANIAAATFPDGEELAFLAGLKAGGATASNLLIDWWAFAQVII